MSKKKRQLLILASAAVVVIMIVMMITMFQPKKDNTIIVGSESYTEEYILGHMYADLIEGNTDLNVERKIGLGGTEVCFTALKTGEIDMYPEYTGTADIAILNNTYDPNANIDVFGRVKEQMATQYELTVLDQIGFNNAYCLALKRDVAEQNGITKISDLENHKDKFKFSPSFEFMEREDGMQALLNKYDVKFASDVPLEGGLKYTALDAGGTDVIVAFSTDGMLIKYDLVILEDDRQALVQYFGFPLVRSDTLKDYPELNNVLNLLAGKIDDDTMAQLNYKVDEGGMLPEDVAREFLIEQGLYKE